MSRLVEVNEIHKLRLKTIRKTYRIVSKRPSIATKYMNIELK